MQSYAKRTVPIVLEITDPGLGQIKAPAQTMSLLIPLARNKKTEDIQPYFLQHVLPLLDEDAKPSIISALMDIVEKDSSIEQVHSIAFEKYLGIKKAELLTEKKFDLSKLLAGLFLYSVVCVKNQDGQSCIKELNQTWFDSFKASSYPFDWDDYIVEPEVINTEYIPPLDSAPAPKFEMHNHGNGIQIGIVNGDVNFGGKE